jgi:hypothetical protein
VLGFVAALAAAQYQAGRHVEAVGFDRRAIQQRFELTKGLRIHTGIDEARAALAQLYRAQYSLYVRANG